jgi:hypothetical protein
MRLMKTITCLDDAMEAAVDANQLAAQVEHVGASS